jgi:anti-sigma factor RsiW
MLTCREVIEELLPEYLDGTLPSQTLTELEAHLARCAPCTAYINTYRRTRELAGQAGHVEMPPEMKELLRQFIVKHLRQTER